MTYKQLKNGTFEVSSRSGLEKKWIVSPTLKKCDCPKFKYYLKGKSPCHHIEEVVKGETELARMTPLDAGLIKFDYDKYIEPLTIEDFVIKHGDNQLDALLATQQVIILYGRVRKI